MKDDRTRERERERAQIRWNRKEGRYNKHTPMKVMRTALKYLEMNMVIKKQIIPKSHATYRRRKRTYETGFVRTEIHQRSLMP